MIGKLESSGPPSIASLRAAQAQLREFFKASAGWNLPRPSSSPLRNDVGPGPFAPTSARQTGVNMALKARPYKSRNSLGDFLTLLRPD